MDNKDEGNVLDELNKQFDRKTRFWERFFSNLRMWWWIAESNVTSAIRKVPKHQKAVDKAIDDRP